MDSSILSVTAGRQSLATLVWTNEPDRTFHFVPSQFFVTLDVASWRRDHPELDAVAIQLPPTWVTDRPIWRPIAATESISWVVAPREVPAGFTVPIRVHGLSGGRVISSVERTIELEIVARSQFDPARDVILVPNSVDGFGVVKPRRDVFDRTYRLALFPNRLFDGLYRAVVFLGAAGSRYQGGICTGVARAALARSLSGVEHQPSLDEILFWHGRQLSDRALLASALWLFFPSPRRAYFAVLRDLTHAGVVKRCFDIGVPKPWRIDLLSALQQQGHTVVPFRIHQDSTGQAFVTVYDPNDPNAAVRGTSVITFMLDRNQYEYPGVASADDRSTTVIAVEQSAYAHGRTAILAGFASIVTGAANWAGEAARSALSRLERQRVEDAAAIRR